MVYKMRTMLVIALLALISVAVYAEIPIGYYTSLNGKTEAELKTAACNIIYNHTEVSSYSDLPEYFKKTDVYPDGERWWDMYSPEIFYIANGFSGMNREHSVPKSWWGGSTSIPAYVDLFHLYPSESRANTAKSNYPLGVVQSITFENGVSKVGTPVSGQGGGASRVFEPADEYKGDFARTYFYFVTCYQNLTWKWTYMFQDGTYPTLNAWSQELLLEWHRNDPVSQKEIDRNEQVYLVQNNRNPFIDFPQLAEYIWGDKKGELFYTDLGETPEGDPNLITPVQDMALDFGQVAIGSNVTKKLNFKGENLSGSLSLTLSGDDKTLFALSDESISASVANGEDGYWLNVTYTPTATGSHSARLIVSDGGLTGSRGISLSGECLEVPTLSTINATAATDITNNSYTANWDVPAGDVIDYYVVTRTRYVNGTATVEEIEAETNILEITDFDLSDSETYSVQSVRLGHRSAMSNVIFVEHAGVADILNDLPIAVWVYQGGMRFTCAAPHYNARVYDVAGRLVTVIPVIENGMEFALPSGAYFILTDNQSRPLRVIVK